MSLKWMDIPHGSFPAKLAPHSGTPHTSSEDLQANWLNEWVTDIKVWERIFSILIDQNWNEWAIVIVSTDDGSDISKLNLSEEVKAEILSSLSLFAWLLIPWVKYQVGTPMKSIN